MDGEEYETFSMELDMVLVLLIALLISSWLSSEVSIHGTGNRR